MFSGIYSRRSRGLLVMIVGVISMAGLAVSQNSAEGQLSSLLFDDFESVLFVDGSILRPQPDRASDQQWLAILKSPFGILQSAFDRPELQFLSKTLFDGTALKSVALAARNFRAPEGLGPVRFDACYLVQVDARVNADMFSALKKTNDETGRAIWTIPLNGRKNRPATLYATIPVPNYLLVATTADITKSVAAKLARVSLTKPELLRPKEFGSFWAKRTYGAASRIDPVASGIVIGDVKINPKALGIEFVLEPQRKGTLRYLPSDAKDATAQDLNRFGFAFKRTSVDTWETPIDLSASPEDLHRLVIMLSMFGFGGYI